VSCDLGQVGAGAAYDVNILIVAGVGPSALPGISNAATVSSSTPDPTSSNNQASADTAVVTSADLQVTESDAPDPVPVGDSITYALTVHNAGPSPAADVSVSDSIPGGLTLVSATPTQGSCAGTTTITCGLGTVRAGSGNDGSRTRRP
jgi:uncharacterized repeat protein (TIGR01451 family)